MELRPYQIEAREAVLREWAEGHSKTLLCLPTGTGKTCVFSDVVRHRLAERGGKALILAHRAELLEQAQDKLYQVTGLSSALEKADLEMPAGPESAEKAGGLKAAGAACGTGDGSCRRSLGKDPEKTKKMIRMVHNEE